MQRGTIGVVQPPILQFHAVSKVYRGAAGAPLHALRSVTGEVPGGRVISITGRSGSGKSTLLHLAAGIDAPTTGEVRLLGRNLAEMPDRERTLQRRDNVGLVFQFFHLLSHLSTLDNVVLPMMIAGGRRGERDRRAIELLDRVGLADRAADPVEKLSGGEMQRVAICRALLRSPRLLLADEPTGNLDDDNARTVMELLLRLTREEGSTLIYVTHSPEMAAMADESWRIQSGILETGATRR